MNKQPLQPISSIADLLFKMKSDARYKELLIIGCFQSRGYWPENRTKYQVAKEWLNDWIRRNVGEGKPKKTCQRMVEYLNEYLPNVGKNFIGEEQNEDDE